MNTLETVLLTGLIFAAALLYSSVGQGGGSGYLVAMALFGVPPAVMKPTSLTLNILVALTTTALFFRAGCFSWRLFLPFAVSSVPMAFIGGTFTLPNAIYKPIVGAILWFAAVSLLLKKPSAGKPGRNAPLGVMVLSGAAIGLLSGLAGIGGGIFLSPLILLLGLADAKKTAGISAAFIAVNSIAGLAGHLSSVVFLPPALVYWAPAAVLAGVIGARAGSRKISNRILQWLLSGVLVIAGLKMIFL